MQSDFEVAGKLIEWNFLIPEDNAKDLADIPDTVRKKLTFVPVESMDEVLVHALAIEDPAGFFERLKDAPGEVIAAKGAYQIHLALKNKSGGAVDAHAGHNH